MQLVKKAGTIEGGLPATLRSKMMFNVAMDFGIGLIPLVGDFVNILYKCNSRNFILLEKYLVEKYSKQQGLSANTKELEYVGKNAAYEPTNTDKISRDPSTKV